MLELLSKIDKIKKVIDNKKVVILFPGQASQYKSMGSIWYNSFSKYKQIFDYINQKVTSYYRDFIDEDLFSLIENEQKLNITLYSQISIFTVSVCCYETLREVFGDSQCCLAGHSLGEYSLLVCSGCISLDSGIDLVVKRGYYMHNYSKNGTMFAVIYSFDNSSIGLLESILKSYNSVVANYNSYSQLIVSCSVEVVDDLRERIKKEFSGCKIIPLRVSGAFHSHLVDVANQYLQKEIDKVSFSKPVVPICLNSSFCYDPLEIKEIMKNQMVTPVNWIKTIETIYNSFSEVVFIEVLPNKVLTNLSRKGFPSNIADISYSVEEL
ncbi:MAG: ACP S-malonyltransferase [Candidatus Calescibacterium sp.]|nr:ACP S-malonyltransferase [Candidatus Calescibacterium sp.]MCS7243812.1 ACP S-malonyltransferase [Candidatus Calescibacterium sp.]MDW8132731.1 ACP S-malonyltransferase [Candidatus Calescibacterium sp.]